MLCMISEISVVSGILMYRLSNELLMKEFFGVWNMVGFGVKLVFGWGFGKKNMFVIYE